MLTQSHRRLLSGALIISTVLGISYYLTEPTYFHPTPAALRVVAESVRDAHAPAFQPSCSEAIPSPSSTPFIELDDEELRRHRRAILDLRDASIGRLHVLNRDWDAKNELVAGRYQLRSLDLDAYDSEMRFFWHSLMSSEYDRAISRSPDLSPILDSVLARSASHLGQSGPLLSRESHWREKNPGFEVRTMVDIALASWMRSTFGDAAIVAEFISLPKRILQIDAWRYIAVFILGGVWCDSDTAAVKPIDSWGDGWTEETDARLLEPAARRSSIWSSLQPSSSGTNDTSNLPSLIISPEIFSLESQHTEPAPYWVQANFARRVQIAQWTFAATPGHPILLDAIGRIFERGRKIRDGVEDVAGVLDWTGPGLFTDCVFRYLKARWGFDFDTLEDFDHPIRIGDVLILPRDAFQAATSGETQEELDSNEVKHVVWHGFKGSWKGGDR